VANQTGRPIAPARKLVAWIIGTIAFFVIALGLGMSSSPVAFFGLAVLGIAIAVAFMPAPRRGGRATVAGTAEVRSISPPPVAGAYGRATIGLIVVAPGLGAFETTVREPRIPVDKWPLPGATVPITVDVDDTRRVRVSWRDAPARPEGDDPPPPPAPAGRSEPDDLDDEVFGSVDEAPWEGREDDWDVDTDGPGPSSGTRGATTAYARRTGAPVVVRETAAGTIVEGHVVDTDEEPSVLPRRARPFPAETAAAATPAPADLDEPPVPTARTSSDPEIDPEDDTDWPDPEPPWRSPDAGPSAPAGVGEPETATRTTSAFVTSAQTDPPPDAGSGPASGSWSPSASAAGRPPGSRPSPRPRGASATATFEREDPSSGTGEAPPTATTTTATPAPGTVPPAQRTSTESRPAPAADIDLDLDLDGPPTRPVSPAATTTTGIPVQGTHGRAGTAAAAPRREPTDGEAEPSTGTRSGGLTDPVASPRRRTDPVDFAGPADPVSSSSSGPADPVSPAGRSSAPADPVSPAGRTTGPIDPVSPAGRSTRGGGRVPGPTPPPPPAARRADAPTPPPPPVARAGQAAAPPPPARSTAPGTASREQNAWARPAQPSPSPKAPPAPAPRSPASADERWAPPVYPAPREPGSPRPAPADSGRPQPGPAPADTGRAQPAPMPGPAQAGSARTSAAAQSGSTGTQSGPAAAQSGPAWTPPRPASDDGDRWTPVAGSTGQASSVPPNVETRPLGSRTRFFAQPGEETESFETDGEDPAPYQPRPEPTRSSATSTPTPVGSPPTAPEPDRPFPSAPAPAAPRTAAPRPGIDQIDIPLDNFPLRGHNLPIDTNPEPAPENLPPAAPARAGGIIVPPPGDPETPRPSALRDGILGVAVGRAAVSADAFPTPQLDDVPAPGSSGEQRRGGPWGDFNGRPDEHAGDVITGYPSARPSTAGSIHGVGITVLVTDLERSTEFYRDVLGFHEIDNGDGSAVLASGDTRLVLRTVHNLSAEAGRLIYLNLEVGDIEAVHAELREKGVKFVHSPRPVNRGDKLELWSATFRDPDNHNIAITQWRAIH
jgi:catechol 2,3-dioxygenase-like lactoylglutathione lyase family enzyme